MDTWLSRDEAPDTMAYAYLEQFDIGPELPKAGLRACNPIAKPALILLFGAQVIAEFERGRLDAADGDGNFHT
jgi:hypothetical protein